MKQVLSKLFSKTWHTISYAYQREEEASKLRFEENRAERERIFLAECDCLALQTQQDWEESNEGKNDLKKAIEIMTSGK